MDFVAPMALLHISSGGFTVMCQSRFHGIRAVASEGSAALKTVVEEKVKLGGSDLKVTRIGIGAWSWGDTTYWNNFEWNGNFLLLFSSFSGRVTSPIPQPYIYILLKYPYF